MIRLLRVFRSVDAAISAVVVAAVIALFALLVFGCAHRTVSTTESASTAAVHVEATREETATAVTTTTTTGKRTVRKSRIVRPLPDGGHEEIEELEELLTSDGKVSGETKAKDVATVDGKAATKAEVKTVETKTGRPWWFWPAVILAALAMCSAITRRMYKRWTPWF